jgi:SRSO17 transposase
MTVRQIERCRTRLKAYLNEMLAPLGRSERRFWGGVYVRGLLLDGERKSVGAMAVRMPDANEQNLHQFLSQSPWAWQPVWQAMAQRMESAFPPAEAWGIDGTSFPKKGDHSVGVQRQYCGALGKKADCQVAVSLHRTDPSGNSPLGFRLYLPEVWTDDPKRCQHAGVPEEVGFHKKWELALALLDDALQEGGSRSAVVLADSAYGDNVAFRRELETRGLPYAVAVTRDVVVWTEPPVCGIPQAHAPGPTPKRLRYSGPRHLRCGKWPNRTGRVFVLWPGGKDRRGRCVPASLPAGYKPLGIGRKTNYPAKKFGCWWNGHARNPSRFATISATCL